MEQGKNKKIMLSIIGVAIIVIGLVGITYAFFNYTRTGEANTIRVGRINFVTEQTDTISLTNLFPIDPEETGIMEDDTKVGTLEITIEGDTDYSGGIEYLVSSVNSSIYTSSGQTVPISLDVTVDDLGTSSINYFTARENTNVSIYKKLVGDTLVGDGMLLVGYIAPNSTSGTAEGIDGSITIKAYFDKNKILISDTYDGKESDNMGTPNSMAEGKTVITTAEWNALQSTGVSFKVRVEANEGIWVIGSLEEIMRKSVVMDNISSTYVSSSSGINFGAVSSDTNGKGVYMRAGTENDTYPIMYYRGEVDDNNVVFNNKCWKAVRTTDTGGVKLIYNGELSGISAPLAESDYTILTNTGSMTFDTTDNAWVFRSTEAVGSWNDPIEISFSVPNGDGYLLEVFGSSGSIINGGVYRGTSGVYQQNNGFGGGGGNPISSGLTNFGTMATGDSMKVTFSGTGTSSQELVLKVRVMHPDETLGMGCDNQAEAAHITINNENLFAFNSYSNSLSHSGYMYGDLYTYSSGVVSGAYYDSTFIWDGTNYKLTNSATTTKSNNAHYSCGMTTKTATCTSLRYYYYYYNYNNSDYYITLTGGDGIEEALAKMQTNTNDSNAKNKIDTWYSANMTGVTNKLEDTIWCNDRSIGDNNNNGWIANGGDLGTELYYGAYQRSVYASNSSTVKNQPSLACVNKNDRFTWKNNRGNRALDYPVGMITEDEVVLAGGNGNSNSTFYLMSGSTYWTMSPGEYDYHSSHMFDIIYDGSISLGYGNASCGLRPTISIKPGTPVVSGTGTILDPYIIKSS